VPSIKREFVNLSAGKLGELVVVGERLVVGDAVERMLLVFVGISGDNVVLRRVGGGEEVGIGVEL